MRNGPAPCRGAAVLFPNCHSCQSPRCPWYTAERWGADIVCVVNMVVVAAIRMYQLQLQCTSARCNTSLQSCLARLQCFNLKRQKRTLPRLSMLHCTIIGTTCNCGTYIKCSTVENLIRDADTRTVIVADSDDAVSFIAAKRKEDRRQRAVSETLTTIKPQQQQQQQW